jgi:DNA excision repair protein ERCC-2
MRELLANQRLDSANISIVARKHQVCPFELSLDVSNWVDVIIGDYNYVFDPTVRLQRYFGEGRAKHVILIDEAHNLVDRSREMYSASLAVDDLSVAAEAYEARTAGKARRVLDAARDQLTALMKSASTGLPRPKPYHRGAFAAETVPQSFIVTLRSLAEAMEAFLLEQPSRETTLSWLEPYFAVHRFLQVSDAFDETYRMIVDSGNQSVTLFCLDPSTRLAQTLKGLRTAVFFSGTLSPLDYFIDVLGGSAESAKSCYASPFRSDQMTVRVAPLNISFQERARSMDSVVEAVRRHLRDNPGNNLIYCPSLAYLDQLHQKLTGLGIASFAQRAGMAESERESFLAKFTNGTGSVGLVVLGESLPKASTFHVNSS